MKKHFLCIKTRTIVLLSLIGIIFILGLAKIHLKKPEMTIFLKIEDAAPITRGFIDQNMNAYYRGYKVGQVTDIRLSDDQKFLELKVDIFYKGLILPENTLLELGIENILGRRYVSLIYPEKPSKDIIENGEVIIGRSNKFFKRLNDFLEEEFEEKRVRKVINNVENITSTLSGTLTEIQKSSKELTRSIEDIRKITKNPEVKNNIKNTLKYTSKTIKSLSEITESETFQNSAAQAPETIIETSKNLKKVSQSLETTNKKLCSLDGKIPEVTQGMIQKTNCLMNKLLAVLDKRFLFLRFTFGKPIDDINECDNPKGCGSK